MQPSTSTIFGLLRGLCSAPTSRSPITGAAKSPSSEVDGVGPATEKNSSRVPSNLHHAQRLCRFTNGEIQPRGRPFPSHTTSLRYSDSDYEVIHMPDLAYQTPPSYHQCTSGGCRKSHGCARRPVRPVNYQNRRTVIETGSSGFEVCVSRGVSGVI